MAEPVWCFKIMVEAKKTHWLHPTSILDIQSVLAPWDAVDGHMGTPLCRTITLWRWGWIIGNRKHGLWPSLYNVARLWLRLQTPIACNPHPCWMYTQCLSTLRCCGWAYHGYALMPEYIVQVGVNFRKNGVWPSLSDVLRSWLRLKNPIDCIPHPYWIYKVF